MNIVISFDILPPCAEQTDMGRTDTPLVLHVWHAVAYERAKTQSVLRFLIYLSNGRPKYLPLWNWKWKLEA